MKTTKNVFLVSALAIGVLFACSKDDNETTQEFQSKIVEQPSLLNKDCSYVDGNWSSSAVLSTTIVNTTQTNFINSQNTKIASVFGQAVVTLRFVKDATNPGSTYNAISYGSSPRKIYFGEAIYKDALSKGQIVPAMILAHEFGHQLQYTYNLPSVKESTVRPNELEADGFSGYYLRRPTGYNATSFAAIAPAYDFAFAIGDYGTTNPGHHGTPPQRRSAVRLGWLLGQYTLKAADFDYNFFYYYAGVLNGTYKMARDNKKFNPEIDAYINAHMDELRKINSGEMSKEEFEKLEE